MASAAPDVPRLAPPPSGDWWSSRQWAVLVSLLDAVLAPIVPAGDPRISAGKPAGQLAGKPVADGALAPEAADGLVFDRASFKRLPADVYAAAVARARAALARPPDAALLADYLADRASDSPQFLAAVKRTVAGVSPKTRAELGTLLSVLAHPLGAFVLTGRCTPVHLQPVHVREAVLQRWMRSWIPALRVVERSLHALAQTSWAMAVPLFRQVTGYTDAPPAWRAGAAPAFDFVQFDAAAGAGAGAGPAILETDVVIVGSGCGGAVAAQVLAAAGHRVVVVDKGYHFAQTQLPMPQDEGARLLFENGGVLASTDPAINVVAGAAWGGGGTINWSVSLKTPDRVRQEWAAGPDQPGMAFVTTPAFDEALDRVSAFMGVDGDGDDGGDHDHAGEDAGVDHQSHRGRVILDSAAKLGLRAAPLRHNSAGGHLHADGYCHLGCASAEKRGTSVSWLPAAAQAGAQFVEGFHVERVLFDGDDGAAAGSAPSLAHAPSSSPHRAVGVVGTWLSRDASGGVASPPAERRTRRVVIKANKVIVSAGSLWSPVVLRNSGLTNPQIGRNLHLHPCNFVSAFFDEETQPMDKGIITSICTSYEDLDSHYHGVRLEATCMVPYTVLAGLPWHDSLDFKLTALRYRHMDTFIALVRDRDSGRVFPDPTTGRPVVDYQPSALDRAHAVEGVVGLARLCHAAGANEIRAYISGVAPWVRPSGAGAGAGAAAAAADPDPAFEAWTRAVRKAALAPGLRGTTPFASAHQMGTCRMGDDGGRASVVDPRGRVWGTRGLYVADASVFPSASGVNPMVTVMALADHIAHGINRELQDERQEGAAAQGK